MLRGLSVLNAEASQKQAVDAMQTQFEAGVQSDAKASSATSNVSASGSLVWIKRDLLERLRHGQFAPLRQHERDASEALQSKTLDRRKWFSPLNLTKQCIPKIPEVFEDRRESLLFMGQWINHPTQKVLLLTGGLGSGKTALARGLIEMMGGGQEQLLWLELDCHTQVTDIRRFLFQFIAQILHDAGLAPVLHAQHFAPPIPPASNTQKPVTGGREALKQGNPKLQGEGQSGMVQLRQAQQTTQQFNQARGLGTYGTTAKGNPKNQTYNRIQDLGPLLEEASNIPFLVVFDNVEEILNEEGALKAASLKEIFNFLLSYPNIKLLLVGNFTHIKELERALRSGIALRHELLPLLPEQQHYYLKACLKEQKEQNETHEKPASIDTALRKEGPHEHASNEVPLMPPVARTFVAASTSHQSASTASVPSSVQQDACIHQLIHEEIQGRPWWLQLAFSLCIDGLDFDHETVNLTHALPEPGIELPRLLEGCQTWRKSLLHKHEKEIIAAHTGNLKANAAHDAPLEGGSDTLSVSGSVSETSTGTSNSVMALRTWGALRRQFDATHANQQILQTANPLLQAETILHGHGLLAQAMQQQPLDALLILRTLALLEHPLDVVALPHVLEKLFASDKDPPMSEQACLLKYGNGILMLQECDSIRWLLKRRVAPQRLLRFLKDKKISDKHFQPWLEVFTPVKELLLATLPAKDAIWLHRGLIAYYESQLLLPEEHRFYPQNPMVLRQCLQFHEHECERYVLIHQRQKQESNKQVSPMPHEGSQARVQPEAEVALLQAKKVSEVALQSIAYLPKLNLNSVTSQASLGKGRAGSLQTEGSLHTDAMGFETVSSKMGSSEALGLIDTRSRRRFGEQYPRVMIQWYRDALPTLVEHIPMLLDAFSLPDDISLERFWHTIASQSTRMVSMLLSTEAKQRGEQATQHMSNAFENINPLNHVRRSLDDAATLLSEKKIIEARTLLLSLIESIPSWFSHNEEDTVKLLKQLAFYQRQCAEHLITIEDPEGIFTLLESAVHAYELTLAYLEAGQTALLLAQLYQQTQAFAQCMASLERAASMIPKLPVGATLGNIYLMLGDQQAGQQQLPEAINQYQQALVWEREQLHRNLLSEFQIMFRIAECLVHLKQWQRAEQAFANAYQLAKQQQLFVGQFAMLVRLGDVHQAWHPEAPEAKKCYQKALMIAERLPDQIESSQITMLRGKIASLP
jgi:tetratricopeptide (TPR) repeat protein